MTLNRLEGLKVHTFTQLLRTNPKVLWLMSFAFLDYKQKWKFNMFIGKFRDKLQISLILSP